MAGRPMAARQPLNAWTGYSLAIPMPSSLPDDAKLTHTMRAIFEAGEHLQQRWGEIARATLNASGGDYINGIESTDSVQYPFDGDSLAVGVFNTARHAWVVEEGHRAFNLAESIRWGQTPKSRLTKAGSWYIIVPFRHYTKGRPGEGATVGRERRAMPDSIHKLASGMAFGERLTFRPGAVHDVRETVLTATGRTRAVRGLGPGRPEGHPLGAAAPARLTEVVSPGLRRHYAKPGGRSAASLSAAVQHAQDTGRDPGQPWHAAPKYEGLTKTGSKGHEQYMTWRVITPTSNWMIPAQPGHHIAERVAQQARPVVEGLIQEAFARDVSALVTNALHGGG